mmetsp:Transcript_35276/g.105386  ORF Transcript_35276/g.105386 Transcript_35276/m.105386 type:complete len:89 (+) Transcript_35276:1503-1769(+)
MSHEDADAAPMERTTTGTRKRRADLQLEPTMLALDRRGSCSEMDMEGFRPRRRLDERISLRTGEPSAVGLTTRLPRKVDAVRHHNQPR